MQSIWAAHVFFPPDLLDTPVIEDRNEETLAGPFVKRSEPDGSGEFMMLIVSHCVLWLSDFRQ